MAEEAQQIKNAVKLATLEERLTNLATLLERSTDDVMGRLEEILEQTKKTNGRVTALERESDNNKGRRAVITVLVSALTAVITGLIVKRF